MVPSIQRVALVAAVGLSLSACVIFDTVESAEPLAGETGVAVDVRPTIRSTTRVPVETGDVRLVREADSSIVPGNVAQHKADDGYQWLQFVPAEPLEPDTEYRWLVEDALAGYSYYDPVSREARYFGSTPQTGLNATFTTASDPRFRYSKRYAGHAHIYLSFSQAMNADTLGDDTLAVALDGQSEDPLRYEYDEEFGAHNLRITMRRVDFNDAEVTARPGLVAADGVEMAPQSILVETD